MSVDLASAPDTELFVLAGSDAGPMLLGEVLRDDCDRDEQLRRTGRLAAQPGATEPSIEAFVAVRALERTRHREAEHAAARIRSGECLGAMARGVLDARRVIVPIPSGVALNYRSGSLALISQPDPVTPLENLGRLPMHAWRIVPDRCREIADGSAAEQVNASALSEWRILTSCRLIGMMDAALTMTTRYAAERKQFGVPIGTFQAVTHQLATAAILTEGLRTLVDETLHGWRGGDSGDGARALAVFLHAAGVAPRVAEICVHVHGGQGVTEAAKVAGLLRQAKALAVAGGQRAALYRELHPSLVDGSGHPQLVMDSSTVPESVRGRARAFFAEMRSRRPDADGAVLLPALAAVGLLGMTWTGDELVFDLTPSEYLAVAEEAMNAGFELTALTTTMNVAKTLAVVGSPAKQAAVLPQVAAGKAIICLGYSEAQAGSDVAAATTSAIRDGDHWRINGDKLYTSRAHIAKYVFLLTRTDDTAPKWNGLTTFLVPLDTPGIRIEPMPMLSGTNTAATHYDDVVVSDSMRIGDVNAGGKVMQVALDFEHGGGSVPGRTLAGPGARLLARALAVAADEVDGQGRALIEEPVVSATLIDHLTENRISFALERRSIRRAGATGTTGPLASIVKVQSREAYQRACADILDLFGERAVLGSDTGDALADGLFEECYRASQAATIYGGTSEIQRTIIAERWLALPRGSRK